MCSTPFGIKDCCTLLVKERSNPFSQCSTPFGIKDCCTLANTLRPRLHFSAQRLSASKIAAQKAALDIRRGAHSVLNAFRHQRLLHTEWMPVLFGVPMCSTPFGIKDCCTRTIVRTLSSGVRCSTPFGIKDCCTDLCANNDHCIHGCSTPFGIKDCCTLHRMVCFLRPKGAQRLSASKIAARAFPRSPPRGRRTVLNAFRHQRLLHRRRQCKTRRYYYGAQRLSASKIAARGRLGAQARSRTRAQRLSASKIAALL